MKPQNLLRIISGADLSIRDKDGLTALDHIVQDGLKPSTNDGYLYTWGLNKNNCLGSFSARKAPEILDIFHKKYPTERVQQICIDRFHSIIVTSSGKAYSCGHGLGGRLGTGSEKTIIEPKKIQFRGPDKVEIVEASISTNHSLFLAYEKEDQTNYVLPIGGTKVLFSFISQFRQNEMIYFLLIYGWVMY